MKHNFYAAGATFLLALITTGNAFACETSKNTLTYDCALRAQDYGNPFFRVEFEVKIPPPGTRCGGPTATVVDTQNPAALSVGSVHRFPTSEESFDKFTISRQGRRPIDCHKI